MKKITASVKDILSDLLVIFAILAAAGSIYVNFTEWKTGDMAFFLGYKPVYITSGSMEPVIPAGSFILVKQTGFEELVPGDIVTFRLGDSFVTHRFIGKKEGGDSGDGDFFLTKGDANNTVDPVSLDSSMVRGKVVMIFPF